MVTLPVTIRQHHTRKAGVKVKRGFYIYLHAAARAVPGLDDLPGIVWFGVTSKLVLFAIQYDAIDPEQIESRLPRHNKQPIKWIQTIRTMTHGGVRKRLYVPQDLAAMYPLPVGIHPMRMDRVFDTAGKPALLLYLDR